MYANFLFALIGVNSRLTDLVVASCRVRSIPKLQNKNFALCINAGEYEGVSLFTLKMYECLPDPGSETEGFLRVIDEEGEPYYYDAKAFVKLKPVQNGLLIPFRL